MVKSRTRPACSGALVTFCTVVCLLAVGVAHAAVLDFDALTPGTVLNGATLQGVTFSSSTGGTITVRADNYYGVGYSSAHNWILANTNTVAMDAVDMSFAAPVTSLSVTGGDQGGDTDSFLLQVYDNYGALLGSASTGIFGGNTLTTDGSMGDKATVSLSGVGPIYSARVQATSPSGLGVGYDDIIATTAVPEPGTLALMCSGATGMLASLRRRRRR